MRLLYFSAFMGLLIFTLGCSNQPEALDKIDLPDQEKKETCYISIEINRPFKKEIAKNKSFVIQGDDIISDLQIVLTKRELDTDGKNTSTICDVITDVSIEPISNQCVRIQGKTDIEAGDYLVYVVANTSRSANIPPINSNILSSAHDTHIDHQLIEIRDIASLYDLAKSHHFLMFSSNTMRSFDQQFDVSSAIHNQLAEEKGPSYIHITPNTPHNPSKAKLFVDRFISVLELKEPANGLHINNSLLNNNTAQLELGGYSALNIAKQSFGLEKWVPLDNPKFIQTHPYALEDVNKIGYMHILSEYSKISNNKVVGYANPEVKEWFTKNPCVLVPNNTSISIDQDKLLNRQGYVTGTIFQVKEKNNRPFYALKEKNKWVYKVYNDKTQVPPDALIYEEGIMYYTYFIPDLFSYREWNSSQGSTPLYFTILRNVWYTLTLNSISAPGSKFPGGDLINPANPDQEIVIDHSQKLSINITIMPWRDEEQLIEI